MGSGWVEPKDEDFKICFCVFLYSFIPIYIFLAISSLFYFTIFSYFYASFIFSFFISLGVYIRRRHYINWITRYDRSYWREWGT